MMMGLGAEVGILTRTAWCHIPTDDILHIDCRGNLKSYRTVSAGEGCCLQSYVNHLRLISLSSLEYSRYNNMFFNIFLIFGINVLKIWFYMGVKHGL
jgi:hypothetical protein